MNIASILKVVANGGEIQAAISEAESLVTDATNIKKAIDDDLAALKAGGPVKIETLEAAGKLLKDIGGVLATVGGLAGQPELAAIGTALAAV